MSTLSFAHEHAYTGGHSHQHGVVDASHQHDDATHHAGAPDTTAVHDVEVVDCDICHATCHSVWHSTARINSPSLLGTHPLHASLQSWGAQTLINRIDRPNWRSLS